MDSARSEAKIAISNSRWQDGVAVEVSQLFFRNTQKYRIFEPIEVLLYAYGRTALRDGTIIATLGARPYSKNMVLRRQGPYFVAER